MSLTIILIYIIISIFIFISYTPKPKKVLKNFKVFLNEATHRKENNNATNKTVWNIPGPKSLPFFGTKWLHLTGTYKLNKIHEMFQDMHNKYGDIVLEVDTIPIVNLFSRSDIEKVLKYPSKYPFRPPLEIMESYRKTRPDRFKSPSLSNAQGEEWHDMRVKLTSSITSRKILQAFIPTLNDICDDFIHLIREKRDENGCVKNFQDLANSFGLEAVCCLLLGRRMGYLNKDEQVNEKFLQLAKAVKKMFYLTSESYYGAQLWKYFPTKLYREFADNEKIIYDIISEIVDKALTEEEMTCQDDNVRSIFINILQTEGLDIRDKKAGIIDLITGGIETFSNTLSFLLYNIGQDENSQDYIYEEFSNSGNFISSEDMQKAAYTKACIKESFRVSPTAICLARVLEEDMVLSGFQLKAGSFVLCHTKIACQSEDNFKNAHKFVPERWLGLDQNSNLNVNKINSDPGAFLVLPFGIGRRMCPGKKFTEIDLELVTGKLCKEFKIQYKSELDTQFQFLLAPKTPIDISFIDRN